MPLAASGVPVTGVELSRPMVARLREKADETAIPVVIGDMATTRAPGECALVYLVYNTIDHADWAGAAMTADSASHVSVYRLATDKLRVVSITINTSWWRLR